MSQAPASPVRTLRSFRTVCAVDKSLGSGQVMLTFSHRRSDLYDGIDYRFSSLVSERVALQKKPWLIGIDEMLNECPQFAHYEICNEGRSLVIEFRIRTPAGADGHHGTSNDALSATAEHLSDFLQAIVESHDERYAQDPITKKLHSRLL